MATKNSPSQLVSGLGMAMAFLQALINEVKALGGFDEMIHYLSTERGLPTVKAIAELIVKSEWKIPGSLLRRLAEDHWRQYGEPDEYPADSTDGLFLWGVVLDDFGIETKHFGGPSGSGSEGTIPDEIRNQIVGVPLRYPMFLTFKGLEYVVCTVCLESDAPLQVGSVVYTGDDPEEGVTIVESKYFDFTR